VGLAGYQAITAMMVTTALILVRRVRPARMPLNIRLKQRYDGVRLLSALLGVGLANALGDRQHR
jgi:hypothetical protein